MNTTAQANRKHIVIYGETNSGKSTLFNSILGTETSIVSDVSGTTTDPVIKSMELIGYGPVVIIDTAGINDYSVLGKTRMEKTKSVLDRTDFAIYTINLSDYDCNEFLKFKAEFEKRKIPYMIVLTKIDLADKEAVCEFKAKYKGCVEFNANINKSANDLKKDLIKRLSEISDYETPLIGGLVLRGSIVILVIPVDSEAPKGRLILPQVQLIRDCLDNGIRCIVTDEIYLKETIEECKNVALVITDSQAFKVVSEIVPKNIKLTSFSMLMARQKGDIYKLIEGSKALKNLDDGANILIAEGCTHNKNHEDIGTVKIPKGLMKKEGKNFNFDFVNGHDFPSDLNKYDMIIHCGGCMVTEREYKNRINKSINNNVPITNYGVALAYISGILDRCIEIFS